MANKSEKALNNHAFIRFLISFLVVFGLKRQINEFSLKNTIKHYFYAIKNLWNLLNIFNLNINQLVITLICGVKSGSWCKEAVING